MKLAPPPPRLALRLLAYLALGFVASIALSWGLSATMNVMLGKMQTSDSYSMADDARWSVTRWSRAGGTVAVSTRSADRSWGSRQVLGPPNTAGFGDIVTAWASGTQDGQPEWLELTYERAVTPSAVRVHETYNTGALARVTAFTEAGEEVAAWRGEDPVPRDSKQQGVADVPVAVTFPTRRVKVYLDSHKVAGWNEIDAVGLVDSAGGVQWATRVQASSVYGTPGADTSTTPAPADLLPRWAGLARPSSAFINNQVKSERRAVAAYGWPMLAFWDERDIDAMEQQAAAAATLKVAPAAQGGPRMSGMPGGTITFTQTTIDMGAAPNLALVRPAAPGGPAAPSANPAPAPGPTARTQMPMRPIWGGLLVNTLVFATAIAALHWLAVWPLRLAREVSRVRSGRCLECGYDLGYDYLHGCPECGWRRSDDRQSPRGAPPTDADTLEPNALLQGAHHPLASHRP